MGSLRAELDHRQLLINELNHRVKNTMAIVQSLSAQTLRPDRPTEAARADFDGRLMALAGAHVMMTEAEWHSVPLRELVERTIGPFAEGSDRFRLSGPEATLPPKSAVAFALAVHELCVNAAKYGALGAEGGHVDVDWRLADDRLTLTWRETGGPPVSRLRLPPAGTRPRRRAPRQGHAQLPAGRPRLRDRRARAGRRPGRAVPAAELEPAHVQTDGSLLLLTRRGRGTMRSMVEGECQRRALACPPSTTLRAVPLPLRVRKGAERLCTSTPTARRTCSF
jgi:two-component sensor histidine kinase